MFELSGFKFELLSLREESGKQNLQKVNEIYFFWKSFWPKVLDELNCAYPNWADEFYKHTHAGVLFYDGTPVSLHLYMVQNFEVAACLQQGYFDSFPKSVIDNIRKDGYKKLITGGWLTVNPTFSKNPERIAFSRCQMALSLLASRYYGCDGVMGPTRINNGFAQRLLGWGAKTYGESLAKNTPVELIVVGNSVQIPLKEKEQEIINIAWSHNEERKKAA